MGETMRSFSQAEYDAGLGLPPELQGSLTPEAQEARLRGMIEQGVPEDYARERLGLYEDELIDDGYWN